MGVALNLFSLYIFTRASLNKTNMGFLYLYQTVADLIVLLANIFIFRSSILFGFSLTNQSDIICKLMTLFRRFILHASSWMCVLITFDRFIYVYYPNRFKILKSKLSISILIFIMLFLLTIINTPNFLFALDANAKTCTGSSFILFGSSPLQT
jgi:ABC-type xylose transport system permease subunit